MALTTSRTAADAVDALIQPNAAGDAPLGFILSGRRYIMQPGGVSSFYADGSATFRVWTASGKTRDVTVKPHYSVKVLSYWNIATHEEVPA